LILECLFLIDVSAFVLFLVKHGFPAIAIGNPHGLNNTVTLGIVSSLNRSAAEVGIPEKRMNLIQTSAPLNAGNSGGVIANDRGEVVGVAVAVRANAEGIGFAIPIDRVKEVVAELANGKTIAHPFLGIKMVSLTPDFRTQNNSNPNSPTMIPEVNGAIVLHVIPDSPASKALRRYDIIVAIDGKKCKGVKDVQASVEGAGVGRRISIQVIRGGDMSKPIDISVETGDLASANVEQPPTMIPIPIDPRM
jgi:S1-C subfamily serine protease